MPTGAPTPRMTVPAIVFVAEPSDGNPVVPAETEKPSNSLPVTESCSCTSLQGVQVPASFSSVEFAAAIEAYLRNGGSVFGNDINCWDVSLVKDMTSAFQGQPSFNEPLNCWNVSSVTSMSKMFKGATSFNQDLCSWSDQVPDSVAVSKMFKNSGCDKTADPNLVDDGNGDWCRDCGVSLPIG